MRRRQAFQALHEQEEARRMTMPPSAVNDAARGIMAEIKAAHPEPIMEREATVAHACPKCGRELKARGAHFHIRACNG